MKSTFLIISSLIMLSACGDNTEAPQGTNSNAENQENGSSLKTETQKWAEQTKKLGSTAWQSSVEAAKDAAEKSETYIETTKQRSQEIYNTSKEKISETYDEAKQKSEELYNTAKQKTGEMIDQHAPSAPDSEPSPPSDTQTNKGTQI